ncbi:acyl-CoA dehydrogenase [Actinoplanes sp. NPDC051851]|uniref:acyl-CoA dehydrogenase family protein n=1 Tax=Actinoplanes sp. NPDC051851 TaxID=3154753 RepID=UPI00344834F5
MTAFVESAERRELRAAVARLAGKYGEKYFLAAAREGRKTTELWDEAAALGYLGVAVPEEYGGGGGEIGDLAAVLEELATAGCPLLLMVVSPAIVGTVLAQFGTAEQKRRWLPGVADGTAKYAFAITEPDAGSNAHQIATRAVRDGEEWVLNGTKTFISGVDEVSHVLVIAQGPALFLVPADAPGFTWQPLEMGLVSPEKQFTLFFDDVRLPADALIGSGSPGMEQLFAGLNPERIMAASSATGMARWALRKAVEYARERSVWGTPIGAHQGISHPLAKLHVEIEAARLLTQKAAALHAAGDLKAAGEAANMAKYAAGEAVCAAVDQAIQTHGGNGLALEYGLVQALGTARLTRMAPVSREMALNFVAQFSLGLPRSY